MNPRKEIRDRATSSRASKWDLWKMLVGTHLNWINIVSNNHQSCLALFDKSCYVVETEFENHWFLADCCLILSCLLSCEFAKAVFFLSLVLRSVLLKKLEELCCSSFVDSLRKLVYWRRNLQSLHKDLALALETNILGPLNKPTKITLGLNILA